MTSEKKDTWQMWHISKLVYSYNTALEYFQISNCYCHTCIQFIQFYISRAVVHFVTMQQTSDVNQYAPMLSLMLNQRQ